ncbi:MAG: EVE domain-containing protein [SAR202 cluster bacterium]|jgi:predicted RNA-binding protein with PUA-like domain|nr:EVE domain-containing protein [Chloroflexota bacterium]MDP6420259.1 EVE domain-containing protein [SAR202 cluster bacterium]HAL47781.1 EVE domain-containing protein [Dehalococcoidia bacterium]MDP6664974.1 EVE domain-containing protein [SAR202 cluster bacterium]MDP6798647.1 EVE domain-containing protein [SAR202 cluster bacterium]|tara:strand:- start:1631 stop:2122 length:492 start_codon:yes stop_codon:yes gene_type:complete
MAQRRYWLVKSEPSDYSFQDLMAEPDQTAEWDGVRNYAARNTMRDDMQVGDGVLFYHSNSKPNAVVGYATVVRPGYPDDTAWDPDSAHPDPRSTPESPVWYMVDIKAEALFRTPISLAQVKSTPTLNKMALVNNSRLSVQPVSAKEWKVILTLGMASQEEILV